MKRSDAIKQISDNVLINFLDERIDLKTRNLIADCVLDEMEKLGMSPPVYYVKYGVVNGMHVGWEDEQ